MKYWLKVIRVYIEIYFSKTLRMIGTKKSTDPIPKGTPYCYIPDSEKNQKYEESGVIYIKTCKYYRHLRGQLHAGCTYLGWIGHDFCLGDQCKICGKSMGYEEFENSK